MFVRLWKAAVTVGLAVAGTAVLAVPAHADPYPAYLVSQLRQDPVYISSYSGAATPAEASQIKRLIARIPLKTYVVADVSAGPDGQLQDSDLAAVLHDQLGGGLFILARTAGDDASATGFGTSLPVSDAMTAAFLEMPTQTSFTFVQLVSRFVTILLSGQTEQQLTAAEAHSEQQANPSQPVAGEVAAAVAGAVVSAGLTVALIYRVRRRRRTRPRPPLAGPSAVS
jgi:hypothetical protein